MDTHPPKIAVITGAANGLGKALAIELAMNGFDMALLDIDREALTLLEKQLSTSTRKIHIYHTDISREEEVIATAKEIGRQFGKIDWLINNAAISISQPFEQVAIPDFQSLFNTNFWGTVYCTKHFLPLFRKDGNSRLANIISDFALMGFPGKTTYGSSKSAVMGFTNALRTELTDSAIKVSLVIPPPLSTNIVKNGLHISEAKQKAEDAYLEKHGMALEKAAKRIVSGIRKGKYRLIIGSMMYWIDLLSRCFPTLVHRQVNKRKKDFDFI